MDKQFTSPGFDPVKGAEIMTLLGISDASILSIPRYQSQITSIIKYYSGRPNARAEILKVLNGKQGNKLDIIWTHTELLKEKQFTLNKLDAQDFDKDVAAEITAGHISKPKRDLLKSQLTELKRQQNKDKQDANKEQKAVSAAFDEKKLDVYAEAVDSLNYLEAELGKY
jgi:hypothetical protein